VAPFFWETWWFRTVALLVMILTAGGLVYLGQRRRYRRKLAKIAARRAIEEERARIARDIHDDLGASLTRILLLSRPQPALASPVISESTDTPVLGQIHDTSRELIRSMGAVVWAVNPEQDTLDGLADYLGNHAQEFLGLAGIRCRLETPLKLPPTFVSAQVRHNVWLAFKEALNNLVKYSGATEVRVALTPGERDLVLHIEDNGRGIGEDSGSGHGLANMHRRLGEIGGTCVVDSDSRGTRVTFQIQLNRTK
jgi:signal transduction histidine kinase